jgi:hypothetical protein
VRLILQFYFPVIQDCGNGLWTNWTDIPQGGNRPRYPAPALTVMKNGTLLKASEVAIAAPAQSSALPAASTFGMALACFLAMLAI